MSENETEEENSNILFEEFFLDLTESLTSFVEATQEEDKETQEQEEHSTHSCSNRLELKEVNFVVFPKSIHFSSSNI